MVAEHKFNTSHVDDIFNRISPFAIGFDKVLANLNTVSDIANNYPPYNIIKQDKDHFSIEIAAAGFRKDEFNIHLVPEGNKLVVQGVQNREEDEPEYYHKGIGARNFTRTFALAEEVKVLGGEFIDGMLLIALKREVPEEKKPQEIKIT
jgi:molecular chaperone IbpA